VTTHRKCIICQAGVSAFSGRYGCEDCAEWIRRQLREIELYVAWLPLLAQPGRSGQGVRAPGFDSRPPARLDVLVALDPRTKIDVTTEERPFDPVVDDDPDDAPRSVLVALESQARMIREERDQPPPRRKATIGGEIIYLLGATDYCCHQPWIDDMAEWIKGIHAHARSLVGDKPPGPIGPCLKLDCGGSVFWARDIAIKGEVFDAGRCATCGENYYGSRLLRVKTREAVKVTMRVVRTLPNGAVLWHMDPNRGFGWTCPCSDTSATSGSVNDAQSGYDTHFLWTHVWPLMAPPDEEQVAS
jgi:hypothetical protein